MKTKSRIIVLCLMCACLMACASLTGQTLTPQARYYDALKTFNVNTTAYLEIYKLSDAATQAKYKAQIDPVVKAASLALDVWKASLNAPDAATKEQLWNDTSKQLIALMIASGIIKVQ
jgi:hypothetical protein